MRLNEDSSAGDTTSKVTGAALAIRSRPLTSSTQEEDEEADEGDRLRADVTRADPPGWDPTKFERKPSSPEDGDGLVAAEAAEAGNTDGEDASEDDIADEGKGGGG